MIFRKLSLSALAVCLLVSCNLPRPNATATPTPAPPALTLPPPTATVATSSPVVVTVPATVIVTVVVPPTQPSSTTNPPTALPPFCQDTRVGTLLDSFGNALASSNGEALAALISPASGVDVRYTRDGRVVNYDREHFKFVFESTYPVEWGFGAGSGLPVIGSFQEIVLPSLKKVFTPSAQRFCNQIKLGGATYTAAWPSEYASFNYYSVHFPGAEQYGGMDWQTWLAGIQFVNGQPFLRVLLHYEWEP